MNYALNVHADMMTRHSSRARLMLFVKFAYKLRYGIQITFLHQKLFFETKSWPESELDRGNKIVLTVQNYPG